MELCRGIGTSFRAVLPSTEPVKQSWEVIQDLRTEITQLGDERSEVIRQAQIRIDKHKREACELKRKHHKQRRLLRRYRDVMVGLLRDTEAIDSPSRPNHYHEHLD
jgi:hypothetical protein